MAFWRRRTPEADDSDRREVLAQLRFARELGLKDQAEADQAETWVGPALAAWIGETSLYIENVLGEDARDLFEAPFSAPDRAAFVDTYLNRIDALVEQVPNADLRFVGDELRALGSRWRNDVAERMKAGSHWTRSGAE